MAFADGGAGGGVGSWGFVYYVLCGVGAGGDGGALALVAGGAGFCGGACSVWAVFVGSADEGLGSGRVIWEGEIYPQITQIFGGEWSETRDLIKRGRLRTWGGYWQAESESCWSLQHNPYLKTQTKRSVKRAILGRCWKG